MTRPITHGRQGGEHAGGGDQSVVGNAAAGEIGDGDGQGLGALVRGEEQRVEEFVPGKQQREQRRRRHAPVRRAAA